MQSSYTPRQDGSVLGKVLELWRFPVKSMQGERVGSLTYGEPGAEGDRRYAVRDVETGKILSAKRWGKLLEARARLVDGEAVITLPGGVELTSVNRETDEALSEWFGRRVTLVKGDPDEAAHYESNIDPLDADAPVLEFPCPPGTFHDAAAVHLMTTTSLESARTLHPPSAWQVRRFRPGIVVESAAGSDSGYPEETWIGSDVRIGELLLTPFAPTVRCAMPTRSQPRLGRDGRFGELEPLSADKAVIRNLTDGHNNCLGIYAAVKAPGRISLGDEVELVQGD